MLQDKIHSLMFFFLIFDASEAFNFAVLKAPLFFSRIRSLTPLRLKKDASETSQDAMAGESNTEQGQYLSPSPQQLLTGQDLHSPRDAYLRPRHPRPPPPPHPADPRRGMRPQGRRQAHGTAPHLAPSCCWPSAAARDRYSPSAPAGSADPPPHLRAGRQPQHSPARRAP